MNLLISKDGVVLGQTLSAENARRHAMISRMPLFVVTNKSEFKTLPKGCHRALNEDHGATSLTGLWSMITNNFVPYWGKVSVKKVIRYMYTNGECALTREELLDTVPGATWISITTAFSMLKNKEYADGNIIKIDQIDGKYRRTK